MLSAAPLLELDDVKKELLEFCTVPQSKEAILEGLHAEVTKTNYHKLILPLLNQRFLRNDLIGNRRSNKEKFVITQKGLNYLKAIA